MATRLRLQRKGKKGQPFFQLVAADSRVKRDGKFIERLGYYNPNTNPATIEINFDRCLYWIKNGAEPTDTVRAILKYKGVLYKHHLDRGVAKGALTQEQADAKFEKWLKEKEAKIQAKIDSLAKTKEQQAKERLAKEAEIKNKRAEEIAAKNSELAAEAAQANEETSEEEAQPEAAAETPAQEESAEEKSE
ncbi:MAG: 30S ribosomal protein S16 [Bacteroidetes bacterium]|nr:MAG: 30S ribosomal protein S16 [Bacteroidota bacterium]